MYLEEFISQLQECLQGEVSENEISDTLNYYRAYVREEVANGKSEEEVMKSLGSPRLIAHSIIDAHEEAVNGRPTGYYDVEEERYAEEGEVPMEQKFQSLATKAGLGVLLVLLLVGGVFLLRALFPVIVVALVIGGVYKLFTGR